MKKPKLQLIYLFISLAIIKNIKINYNKNVINLINFPAFTDMCFY